MLTLKGPLGLQVPERSFRAVTDGAEGDETSPRSRLPVAAGEESTGTEVCSRFRVTPCFSHQPTRSDNPDHSGRGGAHVKTRGCSSEF